MTNGSLDLLPIGVLRPASFFFDFRWIDPGIALAGKALS
jgi:hypothetical protein